MRSPIPYFVTCTVLAALESSGAALAQDGFDRSPADCVRAEGIRSTQVIDDRTILFYMRGDRVYRNELPDDCPRLAREGRFSYERRVGQRVGRLCRVDRITVIESWGATPYGATCRLGDFVPITHIEAHDIMRPRRDAVDVEEVELPEEDENEPAEGGDAAAADGSAEKVSD